MRRSELVELHYITSIANLSSIVQYGLVSHVLAERLPHHTSVARPEIQALRAPKTIPNGRPLHEYVNLYFNARNKMLFDVLSRDTSVCVLRINLEVLDLPGVVVTDQNAASGYVRFHDVAQGLRVLNKGYLFAASWKHPDDQIEEWRHGSAMCAEILVPDRVPPEYILGAHAASAGVRDAVSRLVPQVQVTINPDLFFRT